MVKVTGKFFHRMTGYHILVDQPHTLIIGICAEKLRTLWFILPYDAMAHNLWECIDI